MAIETEVKIRLDDRGLAKIVGKLGQPKFSNQQNVIYSATKGFLRIREQEGSIILTYKGKRKRGKLNRREEVESKIQEVSFSQLRSIFSQLGIRESLYYEKQRADYSVRGCKVSLDLLPNGEKYVEIEGNSRGIMGLLCTLDLIKYPVEKRSYQQILGHENGRS